MDEMRLEAIKEKEVAVKLMMSRDFSSARDHLRKAQMLNPSFDNIVSMLTLCDILSAASVELPGCGVDHYWVLQLQPSCKFDDVQVQYSTLVSLLDPIKTQFPCIKLAIQLLRDACKVLRDQKKRAEFDLKRSTSWENYKSLDLQESIHQRGPTRDESASSSENAFAFKRPSVYKNCSSRICDGGAGPATVLAGNVGSFGANGVHLERTHQQKLGVIVEEVNSFSASQKSECSGESEACRYADGTNFSAMVHYTSSEEKSCSSTSAMQKISFQDFYNFDDDRTFQHFEKGQVWGVNYKQNHHHNYRYAQIDLTTEAATCVTWLKPIPVTSSERRWCNAGMPVACGLFEISSEEMSIQARWHTVASYKSSWVHGVTELQFEIYPRSGEIWAVYKDWNLEEWSCNPDKVKGCKFEFVEIVSDFSKYRGANGACLVKVDGFSSVYERQKIGGNPVTFHIPPSNLYMFSHQVPAYAFKGGELDKVSEGMFDLDQSALPDNTNREEAPEANGGNLPEFTFAGQLPSFKIIPENKCLMPSWSWNDFRPGEIWAVYWGNDFLPRKYARINKLAPKNQVSVSFLETLPSLDHEIEWAKQELPIVHGIFTVGGRSANIEMSLFSHRVSCEESTSKSCYKIYPAKGEIWAMYKGWNPKWNRAKYASYQCQIVRILSNFTEDGITVSRLGEVEGCLTFFHILHYDGFDLVSKVSREDMLSFSHRIPAFKVPGIGKYDIPDDSWHLEPFALPPNHSNQKQTC